MFPIYFVIGLLNIFSQHHNYGIDNKDPDFDIRVRRSINEDAKQQVFKLLNKDTNFREKRYAYYKKTIITNNDVPQFSNENNNGSQSNRDNGNRYDIFNPNWNFLFNTTKRNRNGDNSRFNQSINNRPIINSYPYGYPPGYGPKTNSATGSDRITTTTGYRNQDSNTPYFYNYQNPNGRNFAGYVGYAPNVSGQGVTPGPDITRANNNNAWNNAVAAYPPSNTQKRLSNTNNLPAPYSTTNNPGMHNLPYATNPVNGIYNNNFNTIPKPFVKDNLSPYAPNFNNGSADLNNGLANWNNGTPNFNNGSVNFDSGSSNLNNGTPNLNNGTLNLNNGTLNFNNGTLNFNNGSYVPVNNINTTTTTTEKIVSGCVICNIPCPQFMKRFGRFCMPDNVDDDY